MPLDAALSAAIFLTIWWIVLLAVMPFGVRSLHEEGEVPEGSDPGAPVAPNLWKKAAITTGVTIVLFSALMIAVKLMG
jgi:predicted secreted protein